MARKKSITEKWKDWRLNKSFVSEKSEKIQVPGIGVYDWNTLTSKVIRMAKDLEKNAKKGNWNKSSRNGIRAFAEMWNALAEYDK